MSRVLRSGLAKGSMSPSIRHRVCHIITGLPVGGTQTVLHNLIAHREEIGCEMDVVSLTELGEMGARIRDLGVPVFDLNMNRTLPSPVDFIRLVVLLRRLRPEIVQTWLYHGDLVGGLAARIARTPRIYWNIRQTNLDSKDSKRATILTATLCARLSRWIPDGIVCCSHASLTTHAALGYDADRMRVVGNGIESIKFKPDPAAGEALRRELGITPESTVIGLVGRFHPQKDHRTFVAAAGILARSQPSTQFLLCGEDVQPGNETLGQWIEESGVTGKMHLLGVRKDLPAINSALDVATSASAFGEGFSNVVIEAMACGTPCVVTDVGESAAIVGDTGEVVPPRSPAALATAWNTLIELPDKERRRLGERARERVLSEYTLSAVVREYRKLYA